MSTQDSNFAHSLKRTLVPVIVGALLAAATRIGIDLPEEATAELVAAVYTAVYYAVLRWLEPRFDWAGTLLGGKGQPSYEPKVK